MRQMTRASVRAALLLAGVGCAFLFTPLAQAANAQSQYQRDVEYCNTTPGIDKAACLKEAGAAAQAARSDALTAPGDATEAKNRLQRCDNLTGSQRQECLDLMNNGAQVREQGSVQSGGILRETTITIPAPASNP